MACAGPPTCVETKSGGPPGCGDNAAARVPVDVRHQGHQEPDCIPHIVRPQIEQVGTVEHLSVTTSFNRFCPSTGITQHTTPEHVGSELRWTSVLSTSSFSLGGILEMRSSSGESTSWLGGSELAFSSALRRLHAASVHKVSYHHHRQHSENKAQCASKCQNKDCWLRNEWIPSEPMKMRNHSVISHVVQPKHLRW